MRVSPVVEIIKDIIRRQKEILDNVSSESVAVYLWLRNEYKKKKRDDIFEFVFKSYYQLNHGGLGDSLKNKYFELLNKKVSNLELILNSLYKISSLKNKKTIQFSFTTKLLHTLDDRLPIYDHEVGIVTGLTVRGVSKRKKIESAKEIYIKLENLYFELLKNNNIKKVIKRFRKKFKLSYNQISDQKVLDFILWSFGKLKKNDRNI